MKKENPDLKFIETLVMSKAENKPQMDRVARELVKKFFSTPLDECFDLLTPTYISRVNKKEWLEEARVLMSEVNLKFKIRKVKVQSGCLVIVKGIFKITKDGEGNSRNMSIQLMKERGAYDPDPTAEMRISGITVPPFLVPSK